MLLARAWEVALRLTRPCARLKGDVRFSVQGHLASKSLGPDSKFIAISWAPERSTPVVRHPACNAVQKQTCVHLFETLELGWAPSDTLPMQDRAVLGRRDTECRRVALSHFTRFIGLDALHIREPFEPILVCKHRRHTPHIRKRLSSFLHEGPLRLVGCTNFATEPCRAANTAHPAACWLPLVPSRICRGRVLFRDVRALGEEDGPQLPDPDGVPRNQSDAAKQDP